MNFFYLKQATASQVRSIGPFLNSTDFTTPATGLTIANTDVKLVVNGAASVNKNSGGGTHRANGIYSFTFDATDTASVGDISGSILISGTLLVIFRAVVLEEAVYDQIFALNAPGAATPAALAALVTTVGTAGVGLTAAASAAIAAVASNVTSIKASTDNLPVDPADQSLLIAATNSILTAVGDVPTNAELDAALALSNNAVLAILGTPEGASIAEDISNVYDGSGEATAGEIADAVRTELTVELAAIITIEDAVDEVKDQTDRLTFTGSLIRADLRSVAGGAALEAGVDGGQSYGEP